MADFATLLSKPLVLMPASGVVLAASGCIASAVAAARLPAAPGGAAASAPLGSGALSGPALVTVGWVCLLYTFLFAQSLAANYGFVRARALARKRGERCAATLGDFKYGGAGGALTLTATRTVGNALEQAVPFLAALWLHALAVDAGAAASLGWAYVASRAVYPIAYYANQGCVGCCVLCCAVLCCAVLCCAVLCCVVLCRVVLCCVVLCCVVLCRGGGCGDGGGSGLVAVRVWARACARACARARPRACAHAGAPPPIAPLLTREAPERRWLPGTIFLSTLPGYALVAALLLPVALAAARGAL